MAGGSMSKAITVGPGGEVLVTGRIDPDRVASDFTYNFDIITTNSSQPPVYSSVSPTWLTYNAATAATPLGTAGTTTAYKLTNSVTGDLSVAADAAVALIVPVGTTIKLNGSDGITVPASATLIIFAEGDLDISGSGNLNACVYAPSADIGIDGGGAMGITAWKELTSAAQRGAMAPHLSF